MGKWDLVRQKARALHAELCQDSLLWTAEALLAAAEAATGIGREGLPKGDPLLYGAEALLDPEDAVIRYNLDADPGIARYYQAHEYAHHWQHAHHGSCTCSAADLDPGNAGDDLPFGVRAVEGYSPLERRELEANLFAREFLLPSDKLRHSFLVEGASAGALAVRIGLPEALVLHQLTYALLAVEGDAPSAPEPAEEEPDLPLDARQAAAAQVARGPFLLEAGPGTGKTRTLVRRVLVLLEQGAAPESILALTFSNRAAEEMRARLARRVPDAAPHIWIGTFHAFGLELLRKYGRAVGLPERITVLDTTDAALMLERNLASLPLVHYQNLYDPPLYLDDILGAISRAKDELVGPERYLELAAAMRARAATPEEVEAADKAYEVGEVYRFYQQRLAEEELLDFGDLIFRAVALLQGHPEVRKAVRQSYRHILVDEYQDVNRASGVFLKEIAGDGSGLWVVGDVRQAIYRFRGAAPRNMTLFTQDFPNATVRSLPNNYRSQQVIVDLFAALAPKMRATQHSPYVPWTAVRKNGDGYIRMEIAEDEAAEGENLARTVRELQAAGIPYREQAVLCRSHTQLARIAACLEQAGVPSLSLGNLFARPEIRDLLSLVSLVAEESGVGLVRVARFPEYKIPLADVRQLLAYAGKQELGIAAVLAQLDQVPGLSGEGRRGLELLGFHLAGLWTGGNAWSLLARYLFDRSGYLGHLPAATPVAGQQQGLAVYQLLLLAYGQRRDDEEEDSRQAFLRYVRRLQRYSAKRQLSQAPEGAAAIDAVRLLTVHAAKGLEFDTVFVPYLGRGRFPATRQYDPCPPPEGMLPQSAEDEHKEEEESLFFVALSRARNRLWLSRALTYGRGTAPSELLTLLADHLPYPCTGAVTWPAPALRDRPGPAAVAGDGRAYFDATELETYFNCPRQYYYTHRLGLRGDRADSAYFKFHRCVYQVVAKLQEDVRRGERVDAEFVQARLTEVWQESGPVGHPYAPIYWRSALAMVQRSTEWMAARPGVIGQPEWEVPFIHGRIRVRPDHVEVVEEAEGLTVVARRTRTGRASKQEDDKEIYALYHTAAELAFPKAARAVQALYLATGETRDIALTDKKVQNRLKKYDDALADIRRHRFPAAPADERRCPTCAYFFICPSAEDSA